jgi:hypothetical protein
MLRNIGPYRRSVKDRFHHNPEKKNLFPFHHLREGDIILYTSIQRGPLAAIAQYWRDPEVGGQLPPGESQGCPVSLRILDKGQDLILSAVG